ncbi:6008_t:CDS:2, partial [Entrophospora sp. SA101]
TRQGVIFVDIPANIMKLGKAIGEGYLSHNTAILGDTSIGGCIIELKTVADDFLAGQSFEVIKLQIVTEVKKKFDFTKLLRGQSCHEVGKHVIGALLVSKEIDTEVFREFFGDENPVKF